ncbi:Cell wall-associated hydrolases (invasion- associated proteins) [Thermoanaerobacter thermohydrosulfuricus WC1]|uniref:Cell wall-associated hydrolases (Invasion-associated proteins) n=1 Tax=Thermoanaerobacter thermohydrosulfuricus WC1 TaxID=1198630 RepID=M8DI75_THETY|nr:SH3 domain-containing protein [Thermoanaerobacter thermohydrosulfuricus]EMT39777.1 Cell wall-associated hydrolases (invasion- associated proteins) [Thermoanaerobacter thermohydrosulfuricus WC1]
MFEVIEDMLSPEYWIRKIDNADKVIMTPQEIENFNRKIINKVGMVCDIETYKESLKKDELIKLTKSYEIPKKPMYNRYGNLIEEDFYDDVIENTNLEKIEDVNPVKYGIAIRNTSIRSFPTEEAVFDKQGDIEFDRFQETGCQAFEPLVILHKSKDKKWYFVQMYNYSGWIKAEDIAVAKNKKELFDYINSLSFLLVTGNYIKTQSNPFDKNVSKLEFTMGTKIYLEKENILHQIGNQSVIGNYLVKLPVRNEEGNLDFRYALISKKEDVNVGYLPYTRENILKQAFKLIGDRYGWGDSLGGRDCSSYIMYIFKTFGIRLPRNADEQEISEGKSYKFTEEMPIEERIKVFDSVKPGALVYMPGHAMMYIGKEKGIPYIIHDFHGYGEKKEDKYEFIPVNEVMVTSVLLPTASGVPFIEKFTSVLEIE